MLESENVKSVWFSTHLMKPWRHPDQYIGFLFISDLQAFLQNNPILFLHTEKPDVEVHNCLWASDS